MTPIPIRAADMALTAAQMIAIGRRTQSPAEAAETLIAYFTQQLQAQQDEILESQRQAGLALGFALNRLGGQE